jgi:hypothetical protein
MIGLFMAPIYLNRHDAAMIGLWGRPHGSRRTTFLPSRRLEHRLCRNPRPRRDLVAKGHVGVVHLFRTGTFAGEIAQHIVRRRARCADEIGRKSSKLHIVARFNVASGSMLSRSISASLAPMLLRLIVK